MNDAKTETTTSSQSVLPAVQRLQSVGKSSLIAGLGGIASFVTALRDLGRGNRRRGLLQLVLSAALFLLAVVLRRPTGTSENDRAEGDQSDTAETSIDITDDEPSPRPESDGPSTVTDQTFEIGESDIDEAADTEEEPATSESHSGVPEKESYERLGEASFDEHNNRVPVSQRIFNTGLLALGGEAYWGVHETDETVFVSQRYDAIEERDDVRYIGSSEIDQERMLSIPGIVVNQWNNAAGGSTAVPSGTKLVFVTRDDLQEDGLVLVVPEQWIDDILDEE